MPKHKTEKKLAAIVLAAGLGTRMKSERPKVLHALAGKPMIAHLLDTVAELKSAKTVCVIGSDMDAVAKAVSPHPVVIQKEQLGTGHAVLAARAALDGFEGDVLILYGDTPLVTTGTLEKMLAARRTGTAPAVVVLGFRPIEPAAYGRLVLGEDGALDAIVEAEDATAEQARIELCNSGVMLVDAKHLFALLDGVGNANAKGEYYLTDIVALARSKGLGCAVVEGAESELIGVNSRADLARAEKVLQDRLRSRAMENGATLTDPESVFFNFDTQLGRDVTVGPNVVFGPGAVIGDGVEICAFCHIEGARVAENAIIGPFARLRPGADVGVDARVGNFCEVKNSTIGTGAKVNHLTYIGDADIGAGANIGAGTITCNYDGFLKSRTEIGADAFIGSNTALVAPVTVGAGAIIGAGSVVARDVDADALALTRAEHKEFGGWAKRYRDRKRAEKAAKGKKKT